MCGSVLVPPLAGVGRRARGGDGGGGTREQCGSNKDWFRLVRRGGAGGPAWGGWAREREDWGGGFREQCLHWFHLFGPNNWSDLAGDEGGVGGAGVGQGGQMGGGTREQCGSNKECTGSPFWAQLV